MTLDTNPEVVSPAPGPAATPRWMKIALVISVALNLAVVGAIAGAALFGPGREHRLSVRELGFGPFDRALSLKDREALRDEFQARMGGRWSDIRAVRKDLGDFLAALRAQPFQPDTLWSLADQQEQRLTERLKLGQRLLIERVVAMTDEERQRFADRLEEEMSHGRRMSEPPPMAP
ncbi:periplasmic heavy metal sensor [Tabrizicola sp. J26]|uniref:periplasmic heavy metal sensor n=1 Tax=Alitabrizicola rongguiensis TaxID=2909234 RepID=UPI001F1D7D00|nr:periplasmic heavy metal sensor [Tabrizicola rongguiensis]MCF1708834.1 periplasmic heavy metal sensor [Tabrizicola rongguiensis]